MQSVTHNLHIYMHTFETVNVVMILSCYKLTVYIIVYTCHVYSIADIMSVMHEFLQVHQGESYFKEMFYKFIHQFMGRVIRVKAINKQFVLAKLVFVHYCMYLSSLLRHYVYDEFLQVHQGESYCKEMFYKFIKGRVMHMKAIKQFVLAKLFCVHIVV